MWATIRRLYGARSGEQKVERMGHVRGGYARIVETAARALEEAGVTVRLEEPVAALRQPDDRGSYLLSSSTGNEYQTRRAILTVPCPTILKIVKLPDPAEYWSNLQRVEYLSVVCVLLVLSRPLSPYYVTNLLDQRLPFTGIIEATNIVAPEDLGGRHLVYLPKYCPSTDAIHELPDDAIRELFLGHLKEVFPDLDSGDVLHAAVFRESHVQPLQEPNALDHGFSFETPWTGVYASNTAMIRNSTLNNNAVLELAGGLARCVAAAERRATVPEHAPQPAGT
mgnify:CR=1 FL=1